jgi:hypothetical protein
LPALKGYLEQRGAAHVRLAYFGMDTPRSYGITAVPVADESEFLDPRPELYAVSLHLLIRLRLMARHRGEPRFDWLDRYRPAAILSNTIYVYDFGPRARP